MSSRVPRASNPSGIRSTSRLGSGRSGLSQGVPSPVLYLPTLCVIITTVYPLVANLSSMISDIFDSVSRSTDAGNSSSNTIGPAPVARSALTLASGECVIIRNSLAENPLSGLPRRKRLGPVILKLVRGLLIQSVRDSIPPRLHQTQK